MKTIINFFLFLIFLTGQVLAAETKALKISFSNATIIAPIKGTNVTAGYAIIKNESDELVKLRLIEVKPFKAAEIHETIQTNNQMGMRKIDYLEIPPHKTFELKPGAGHIMLFDPSRPVALGDDIIARFDANGQTLNCHFTVISRNDKKPSVKP